MEKIIIEIEDLGKLVEEGGNITVTPEAEEALVQLLEGKARIEEAIKRVTKVIEEKALEINPNFSSLRSDRIKVAYRAFGAKYQLDESKIHFLPKEVYKSKVAYSIDTKGLDAFLREHNALPDGIITRERKKSMSVSLIENTEYGEEDL